MLGVLALNAGRLTTRRELIESLWGQRPPSSAVNVLHTHTKHLRRLLDPRHSPRGQDGVLSTVGDGYLLRLPDDALDLLRFRRTVTAARQAESCGDPARAAALYREALRLWEDDDPLCDVPALEDHPKVWGLKTERRRAQLSYWDLMLRTGNAAEIIAALAVQGAANPLDEAVQATLIRAYQATGQRAIAFDRYETTRRALADELGVEPSDELRRAHRHLLQEQESRTTQMIPRQLPAPVPDFTGRADELAQLDAAHAHRPPGIAIICGTAGVGKTALAVHWGHHHRQLFPHGRIHLDLRGDDTEHALPPHEALGRLLTAVGVPDQDIPADTQSRAARWRTETDGRRLLVLLDNAASADQVRPLLPGTHDTLVLITSRDRLAALAALHGAHRVELDLLPRTDAVHLLRRLLGERAGTDPGSLDSLAAICARLPLALRLAAEYAGAQAHLPLAGVVTRLHRTAEPARLGRRSSHPARLRLLLPAARRRRATPVPAAEPEPGTVLHPGLRGGAGRRRRDRRGPAPAPARLGTPAAMRRPRTLRIPRPAARLRRRDEPRHRPRDRTAGRLRQAAGPLLRDRRRSRRHPLPRLEREQTARRTRTQAQRRHPLTRRRTVLAGQRTRVVRHDLPVRGQTGTTRTGRHPRRRPAPLPGSGPRHRSPVHLRLRHRRRTTDGRPAGRGASAHQRRSHPAPPRPVRPRRRGTEPSP
ncbi:AfsR/SARP family transcriptional regulator [Nonomuraea wenchangensis]|uniref:AfsR/SARP family transcriptional regulator n=1 Tax=Nonomuraea wenchangensis TaxID=568860 RepID=UPI003CCBFA7D